MELFREEVRSGYAVLNEGLVRVEQSGGDPQVIEPLMRAAHSIKGAARIVNLSSIVQLAHAMEDCLVAAQNRQIRLNATDIDLLLQSADLLQSLAEGEANQPSNDSEIARCIQHLSAVAKGESPAPAAVPAAAPSPAPVIQQSPILLGGDDGTQAGSDPRTHRGFPNTSLALTTAHNAWTNSSSFPPAVVTTPTVTIDDFWVIPSGEIRPGIRSPKVWLMAPEKH